MKVLQVTPFFFPAHTYGGPVAVLQDLCCESAMAGCEIRVLTTDANGRQRLNVPTDRDVPLPGGGLARYCRRAAGEAVSPGFLAELPRYVRWADVVHLSTAYSFPVLPTLEACRRFSRPLVWSPMGALQRWEASRRLWLKSRWEALCRLTMPKRTILHVTSAEEERESLKVFPSVTMANIPHGVSIPDAVVRAPGQGLRMLFLGRLDPKKGIERLLDACALLTMPRSDWSLTIAGSGTTEYTEEIRRRIAALALTANVTMAGQTTGAQKEALFASADMLAVPSFTENFAMVVVEALARSVPVLASTGTPWTKLPEKGCGLWVDNDPESLAQAIQKMAHMDLRGMGSRGRQWMEAEFAWPVIVRQMTALYQQSVAALPA
jgi:glycosyltransferase involved in cell wall biosynthesis